MIIRTPMELKIGGWNYVEYSDEDSSIFNELCTHGHATPEEAKQCVMTEGEQIEQGIIKKMKEKGFNCTRQDIINALRELKAEKKTDC